MDKGNWYPIVCLIILIPVFIAAAINPLFPLNWLLETLGTFGILFFLIYTYKRFRLSDLSYTCLLIFLILHTVGTHYTYSLVPITKDFITVFGSTRNIYDWIVHFLFGLLLFLPAKELIKMNYPKTAKKYPYRAPITLLLILGVLFEVLEWSVYLFVGNNQLAQAFIAAQGDTLYILFDTVVDVVLNISGSLLAAWIAFAANREN